jgi:N-acyl-D-aspartate/D-glutamate deacylase
MSRRLATIRVLFGCVVACAVAACGTEPSPPPEGADLVIRGGLVVDGTGSPPRRADVAIAGDRIVAIGEFDETGSDRAVDATGLIVAPGFVDIHSHADLIVLSDRATQEGLLGAKIAQGVTTIVVGNCGLGVAPATPPAAEVLSGINGWMTPAGVESGPLAVGGFLDRIERDGIALNVGTLVPHGPVRISVMGLASGAPSGAELAAMRREVARGLDEGAFGLSTGLIYPPGIFSDTDELATLAVEVASRDRLFTSHIRGSSETLLPATRELIEIARRSGARVHHSHMEAVGDAFWPDAAAMLEIEDRARDAGLRVTHDVFVYTRAATMMSAIFPPWSLEGGVPSLLGRLRDPEVRAKIAREIETRSPEWPPWEPGGWPHNLVGAVGWDGILVASLGETPAGHDLVGRSLAEIAEEAGRTPFDVVVDLMLEQDGRVGQQVAEISGRDNHDDALISIFAHPAAAVISDAEDYGRGSPHPAHAGAFPRAFRLARDRDLISVEDVIRKMTSYPASIVGIDDRGIIREGAFADLVIFDPETLADRATWNEPRTRADGVRGVVINGEIVVAGGEYLGGAAGNVLRAGD